MPKGLAGVYVLEKVNGSAPPVTMDSTADYKFEILSGSYSIDAVSTYTSEATFRETAQGNTTTSSVFTGGTYTVSGTTITLNEEDGTKLVGTISNGVLVITSQGITVQLRRTDGTGSP